MSYKTGDTVRFWSRDKTERLSGTITQVIETTHQGDYYIIKRNGSTEKWAIPASDLQ